MIILMILYLLWETHFGFSSGTVDSRGIKFTSSNL